MYKLESSYGKVAFDAWKNQFQPKAPIVANSIELSDYKTSPDEVRNSSPWEVSSFSELAECIFFLSAMNKRHTLYFRGQPGDYELYPSMFRDKWKCYGMTSLAIIRSGESDREKLLFGLQRISEIVARICVSEYLSPRWRDLTDVPEAPWAIVQHYGLWPTPLTDVTTSLQVAASMALGLKPDAKPFAKEGHVYVVALPYSTEATMISVSDRTMLSRLRATCPPMALRPHYQDGYLVGRYPLRVQDLNNTTYRKKTKLDQRLVAHFVLKNASNTFWNEAMPPILPEVAFPTNDPLLERFEAEFGPGKINSAIDLAAEQNLI